MIKIRLTLFFTFIVLSFTLNAQTTTSVSIIPNYNHWKWDSIYVAKNNFITIAVVPQAGGRILEYNLGESPSLWVEPSMFGKSFAPTDDVKADEWRNFGGLRIVPTPRTNFAMDATGTKTKRWPPPAVLGDSPYNAEISTDTNGVKSINVTSGIQELPVPIFDAKTKSFTKPIIEERLQYKRSVHIEDTSSLVFIKHTLQNMGDKTINRGIMSSSQQISRSKPNLEDGENFRAYIPFDKKNKLHNDDYFELSTSAESHWRFVDKNRMKLDKNNPEHLKKYFNNGTNWNGEVADGIYEVQYDYYIMGGLHIVSSKSWVCFVDKTTNTAFAKILEPFDPTLEYEDGVNVSIYNSALSTGYLETEIRTPNYTIEPGKCAHYLEIHGAAKIASTPILDVNLSGIITKKMNFNSVDNKLTGQYGIFIEGEAFIQIKNNLGKVMFEKTIEKVNPLNAFSLELSTDQLKSNFTATLLIKDAEQKNHILETYNYTANN